MTLQKSRQLQKLRPILKSDPRIWDLVLFGSSVRGKLRPGDLDVAIIFNCLLKLDEKLSISQTVKEKLGEGWQVIGVDLNDFTDEGFVARTGIIAEGYSIRRNKPVSTLLGFTPTALFTYSLEALSNTDRTRLKYALSGRKKEEGLLPKWGGTYLGKGCIQVPVEHMDELKELFERYEIRFTARKTLIQL